MAPTAGKVASLEHGLHAVYPLARCARLGTDANALAHATLIT
jgi:hypothetical protein